jgi:hypothetical protein
MIKLFRNIRQNLLAEGKTTKYLKYAIGEIILVVIGILIALSLNNWNENRKARILEANFFSDVLGDLQKDEAKLNYLNDFHLKRIEFLDTLLFYIRNPKKDIGIEKFTMYVEPLYYVEDPSNYSTSFESAKTSGSFSNFHNKDLMKDLTQYYADFKRLESNIISIRAIIENQLEPVVSILPESYISAKTGSLVVTEDDVQDFYKNVESIPDNRNLEIDYESVMQDHRFESYIIGDLARTFNVIGKLNTRKASLKAIKMKIKTHD